MANQNHLAVAHTIFCDEVVCLDRQKFTPMGVYASTMILDHEVEIIPRLTALTLVELSPANMREVGRLWMTS